MLENIVSSIICDEYQRRFKDNREFSANNAMRVRFSLSCDYEKEDGYRNLEIVLYNFGNNYVGVFASLDWNVFRDDETVKDRTPLVYHGYHDSGWRESVDNIIWEFRERINTISTLWGGWYKAVPIDEDTRRDLRDTIRKAQESRTPRVKLSKMEFQFQ